MPIDSGIVCDGHVRARNALIIAVRAEVTAEFAERLANASFVERLRLLLEMDREVERRVSAKAPHDALY